MFLTGSNGIYWPVGKPVSLGGIHTSHFDVELTRAGQPFPWAHPARKHWPKPMGFVALSLVGLQQEHKERLVPEIP